MRTVDYLKRPCHVVCVHTVVLLTTKGRKHFCFFLFMIDGTCFSVLYYIFIMSHSTSTSSPSIFSTVRVAFGLLFHVFLSSSLHSLVGLTNPL